MIKEGRFGTHEAIGISTVVLLTKVFYTNPGTAIKGAGTAAWYSTLISAFISIIIFLLVCVLMRRFPNRTLGDIFEDVFGKIIGKLLSLVFIGYFIFYAGSNLREFVEMIKAYNLPYTPPSVIIIAFLIPVILIAYLGNETLSRISYIGFWFVLVAIAFILCLDYPFYKVDCIFPLAGFNIKRTIVMGVTRTSAYDEVIILAFMINSIQGVKNFKKAGIIGLIISGITVSMVILCSIIAYDYTMAIENLSDLFELSREIYFGRFFQRFEAIFIFVWVTGSIITVAAFFYTAISIYCRSFKINNSKPILLPFVFITYIITLLPENLSKQIDKGTNFQRIDSGLIIYLIPIMTLIASFIFRKKGVNEKNGKT